MGVMRWVRKFVVSGVAAVTLLASAATALALWSARGATGTVTIPVGEVSFDARGQSGTTTAPQYSLAGEGVRLVLPGSKIVEVLDQIAVDPDPVIWRFWVDGYAQGYTGMNFDLAVTSQISEDGTVHDVSSGTAAAKTVLAFTTLRVYPGSSGGDCSAVPEFGTGDESGSPSYDQNKNIYVFSGDDHELQSAGAYSGTPTSQLWCVAMDFNKAPDGFYANEVQAIGTGEDATTHMATTHGALNRWDAIVAFRPALDPLGEYINRVEASGTAIDGTTSRAYSVFQAIIGPDPNHEPDLAILLTPKVTTPTP